MANSKPNTTKSQPIPYPESCQSKSAQDKFKKKTLGDNPEILYHDVMKNGEISNFIFYTTRHDRWYLVLLEHYSGSEREIQGGKQITVSSKTQEMPYMTISVFARGTVMIQGKGKQDFEEDFETLKEKVKSRAPPDQEDQARPKSSGSIEDLVDGIAKIDFKQENN